MNFKKYIKRKGSPELYRISRRKGFPETTDRDDYIIFLNTRSNISDDTLIEFDNVWDEYWIERQLEEGEKNVFKRDIAKNSKCKKAG